MWKEPLAQQLHSVQSKVKKKKEEETSLEENTNITIGTNDDEWGDDVDYSGLMLAQPSSHNIMMNPQN